MTSLYTQICKLYLLLTDDDFRGCFPKLQEVKVVIGGVSLSANACDEMLKALREQVEKAMAPNNVDEPVTDTYPGDRSTIIVHFEAMSDFLRDKDNAHVFREEDIESHYDALTLNGAVRVDEMKDIIARCSERVRDEDNARQELLAETRGLNWETYYSLQDGIRMTHTTATIVGTANAPCAWTTNCVHTDSSLFWTEEARLPDTNVRAR